MSLFASDRYRVHANLKTFILHGPYVCILFNANIVEAKVNFLCQASYVLNMSSLVQFHVIIYIAYELPNLFD